MLDEEKKNRIIEGLKCCAEAKCEVCSYENQCFSEEEICTALPLAKDALWLVKELLKKEEPIEPVEMEKEIEKQREGK